MRWDQLLKYSQLPGFRKRSIHSRFLIDTRAFRINSRKIEDKYKFNSESSIYEIIVRSSNVGSARLALMVGKKD